jgi:hypothetical protein
LLEEEAAVSSKRNIVIIAACAFLFGLLFAYYLYTIGDLSQFPVKTDFYKFYKSAGFFLEGKSIYSPVSFTLDDDLSDRLTPKAKAAMNTLHPNMNAPFHTLFVLPLGALPFNTAFWLWSIISLCLSLITVGLIAYIQPFSDYERIKRSSPNHHKTLADTPVRIGTGKTSVEASGENQIAPCKILYKTYAADVLILWIIILLYFPTWVNIASGQFGLFLLGTIVLIWLSARKRKYQLAGIILGIAMSVKIFLGLFLVFFAVQRRSKVLFCAVTVFVFCNIISLIVFGFSDYKKYLDLIAASHLYINSSWNASLCAFFTRVFGGAENIPLIELPAVAYGLAFVLSFLLIAGLMRTAWRRPRDKSALIRFDIGFSLTIAAMLLISPFGWIYYFPALIITMLTIWHASSALGAGRLYKPLLIGAWILTCIPVHLINSEEAAMNEPIVWFTTSGYSFYALIIFCCLLFALSRKLGKMKAD